MIKHLSITILATVIFLTVLATSASAAPVTFDLKKTSNNYKAFGTISIDRTNNTYTYSAVVTDLPSPLPNNGIYYLLWGLTPDGKADNLGPITNNSEVKGNLNGRMTQFFITSEKERYPEFVTVPKIVQTDSIPESTFNTPTNTTSPSPSTSSFPSGSNTPPVGGPTGAPETGLGGSALFSGLIAGLLVIGTSGLVMSIKNRYSRQKHI